MKRTLVIIAAAVTLLAACDKIEPSADGTYSVYAGSAATWTDGTPIENPVQRAYVEKYTGPRCVNCPAADRTLEVAHQQLHDQLVLLSVNSGSESFGAPGPNSPDMRTDDGKAWEDYWSPSGLPTAYINRNGTVYDNDMATITGDIQAAAAQPVVVALEGTASGTTELTITVNLQFVQECTAPLTLTLALVEDSLAYWQIDGGVPVHNYVHNHMLRDVITDIWGTDIDCTGSVGECRKGTFTYTLPDNILQRENCHVVALVSDKASRRVLNSAVMEDSGR